MLGHVTNRFYGRLWAIQGLPTQACHGMVETHHGADFSCLCLFTNRTPGEDDHWPAGLHSLCW